MADYGNDERVEVLWAIKAMEHAEVYFNVRNYFEYQIIIHYKIMSPILLQILCSVDPKQIPRLSQYDNEIYEKFRKDFPDMNVAKLNETADLKSEEMKKKWRAFCEEFNYVEDYSFATLVRLDSR